MTEPVPNHRMKTWHYPDRTVIESSATTVFEVRLIQRSGDPFGAQPVEVTADRVSLGQHWITFHREGLDCVAFRADQVLSVSPNWEIGPQGNK